jgi:predicted transcriptional regulator
MGTDTIVEISKKQVEKGVPVRWIMQDLDIPEATEMFKHWTKMPETRTVPKALGHIVVTEKAALFTIRGNDGKMSYESFSGDDPSFMKWASDFFAHEWQRAKPWHP